MQHGAHTLQGATTMQHWASPMRHVSGASPTAARLSFTASFQATPFWCNARGRASRASAANRQATARAHAHQLERNESGGVEKKKVVVCGGGVIGVCTAYFLAQRGYDVTVVEQSSVACAASGKAGGFLALDWCRGPVGPLARLSFNLHAELAARFGDKYEYRRVSTLSVQVSQPKEGTPIKSGKNRGLPDWIDRPVNGHSEIGSTATTAQVHPKLFTETLLEEAITNHGARLVLGKVEDIETVELEQGSVPHVSQVVVDGSRIPADAVVFALGPWSSQCHVINKLVRISGLKANSVVLKPTGENSIGPHMLFLRYRSNSGRVTEPEVYPRPSGLIYACGMSSDGDPPSDPADILPVPAAIPYLQDVAACVSSQLEGAEVVAAQACYLPCSEDGVPVIGALPEVQGAYVATGHSCWGILNAPATGLVMAELIADGQASSVDISAFSPKRFASRLAFR